MTVYAKINRDLTDTGERKVLQEAPVSKDDLNSNKPYWVPVVEETVDNSSTNNTKKSGWVETVEETRLVRTRTVSDMTTEEVRASMVPLTPRQVRLGLVGAGITLAQVQAAIDSIRDDTQKAMLQIEWDFASQFERDNAGLVAVSSALGLTDEQIDAMWLTAKEL